MKSLFFYGVLGALVNYFEPGYSQPRDAASGWSTTYVSAQQSMVQINDNQIPESLAYQSSKSRVITSNIIGDSKVMGVPLAIGINDRTVTFYENDMYTEFDTNNVNSGTFGVKIDPVDDSILWSAQGQYPPTSTSSCAIQKTNLTSGVVLNIYNFASLSNAATGCLLSDIVIQAPYGVVTTVYATDFYGYRIYKLNAQNGQRSVLSTNETLLRTGDVDSGGNGPNGIALYTDAQFQDWLIIGVAPNRLVKMSTTIGSGQVVQPGINTPAYNPITTQDGIYMQAPLYPSGTSYLQYILYVVGATALPNGTVQVLTSTTEWVTYELRSVYSAGCGGTSYAPAVTLAAEDLLVLCNNNFAPGYANINRVTDVTWGINPLATTISTQVLENMSPESMSYDPNRNMIVMGSLSDGTIRGWPYNAIYQTSGVTYGSSDSHVYVQGGTDGMYSTAGINVNPYNVAGSDCYCFVCMGGYPPNQSKDPQTGLYLVDLCTDSIVDSVPLPVAASTGSMANDVTTLNGMLYVTDVYGSQVYSVDFDQSTLTMSNPQVILTANDCAENDPSFCVAAPDGIEMVTYGGNSAKEGFLIISMLNSGLMKYIPSSKKLYKIQDPTGVVWGFDGMRFNNDGTVLYGTRNPSDGETYQTVMAVSSCNYWANASLVYSFQLNCQNTNSPAVWPVGNTFGSEDLLILCNDNFGPGPYSVQHIFDVNSIVSNQADNLSPGSCSGESTSSSGAAASYRWFTSTATVVLVGVSVAALLI